MFANGIPPDMKAVAVARMTAAGLGLAVCLRIKAEAGLLRRHSFGAGSGERLANAWAFHQADSLSQHIILTPFRELGSLTYGIYCRLQIPPKKRGFSNSERSGRAMHLKICAS